MLNCCYSYELMCTCWELTPSERPTFSDISESLAEFMDEQSDYPRQQTRDIDDNYYSQPPEETEKPIYSTR